MQYGLYPEAWIELYELPPECPEDKEEITKLAHKILYSPKTPKVIPITASKFTFSYNDDGYLDFPGNYNSLLSHPTPVISISFMGGYDIRDIMAYAGNVAKFALHWESWGGSWSTTTTDEDYARIKGLPFWGELIN